MNAPGVQLDLFAPAGRSEPRTYLATAVLDRGAHCSECGSHEIYTRRLDPRTGAYCAGCGRWVRWINAREQARVSAQGGDV